MDTRHSVLFFSANSRSISSSRQKAFTTDKPEMLSSTCPFSWPRLFCCCAKSLRVRLVTVLVKRKISSTPHSETSVKSGLSATMAQKIPAMVKP